MGITNYLNKVQIENTLNPLDQRQALFSLFHKSELEKIAIFKYTKGEKWEKRELLNLIDNEIDFSKPLSSSIKTCFNMRQLLCIEVATNSDKGHDSILYSQLMNIKSKYHKYGGGIKIDIYDAYIHPADGFFYKILICMLSFLWLNRLEFIKNFVKNNFGKYKFFYLISISEDLLTKLASDLRLETFNLKKNFRTTYHLP